MTDLLTLLREHDLPPRWDGLATWWEGWTGPLAEGQVFLCPPPKKADTCPCGSTAASRRAKGYVARVPAVTHDRIRYDLENRERLGRNAHKAGRPVAEFRLYVWRCPDCLLDVVWDVDTGEWWDLDHTDYGPDGSRA